MGRTVCPHCGRGVQFTTKWQGRRVRCPNPDCRGTLQIPASPPDGSADEPPVADPPAAELAVPQADGDRGGPAPAPAADSDWSGAGALFMRRRRQPKLIIGPLNFDQLLHLAELQKIAPTDEVSLDRHDWVVAEQVRPPLFGHRFVDDESCAVCGQAMAPEQSTCAHCGSERSPSPDPASAATPEAAGGGAKRRHKVPGAVLDAQLAAEAGAAAVCTDQGWLGLIDLDSGQFLDHWEFHEVSAGKLAVTAAGDRVLAVVAERTGLLRSKTESRIYAATHGIDAPQLVTLLEGGISELAFGPSDDTFLVARAGGALELWTIDPPRARQAFQRDWTIAAFCPQRSLAALADAGSIELFDLSDGAPRGELAADADQLRRAAAFPATPTAIAFSADGRRLLAATGQRVADAAHRYAELGVAVGGLKSRLLGGWADAVGSGDSQAQHRATTTLRCWDTDARALLVDVDAVSDHHTDGIATAAISPDGRRALTAGFDDTVHYWQLDGPAHLACLWKLADAELVQQALAADHDSGSALLEHGLVRRLGFTASGQEAVIALRGACELLVIPLDRFS